MSFVSFNKKPEVDCRGCVNSLDSWCKVTKRWAVYHNCGGDKFVDYTPPELSKRRIAKGTCKPIRCVNTGEEFESIIIASRHFNCSKDTIQSILKGIPSVKLKDIKFVYAEKKKHFADNDMTGIARDRTGKKYTVNIFGGKKRNNYVGTYDTVYEAIQARREWIEKNC